MRHTVVTDLDGRALAVGARVARLARGVVGRHLFEACLAVTGHAAKGGCNPYARLVLSSNAGNCPRILTQDFLAKTKAATARAACTACTACSYDGLCVLGCVLGCGLYGTILVLRFAAFGVVLAYQSRSSARELLKAEQNPAAFFKLLLHCYWWFLIGFYTETRKPMGNRRWRRSLIDSKREFKLTAPCSGLIL